MIYLYQKYGNQIKAEIRKFTYNGTFLGECFVTAKIESERPIEFEIGDYFHYRNEKFVLNYIPAKQKQAKKDSHGSAFIYENIKFNSLSDELTRVEFLDVVPSDNNIHHTSLSEFSFYANSVKDLAERLQANLDRVFTGSERWIVQVAPECVTSDKNITIDKKNCWEALSMANSEFGASFIVRNRTITIGTAGIAVGKVFGYGEGKGLYDIQQMTNADAMIITRLRAFGSTKNLPNRYYNKIKDNSGKQIIPDSAYIPNLMLPDFPKVIQDPCEVFVESENKSLYGLREGSVYFDGSEDLPDIYPSLEGMTKDQLNAAGITVSLKTGDNENIDECLSAINPSDNGEIPEEGSDTPKITDEFTIYLKDLGFDLSQKDSNKEYVYATSDVMQISMKSGMCIGRTFDIAENGITKDTSLGYVRYKVRCKRFTDDSIAGGTAFPNNKYTVKAGDKFVILGISMPEVYIKVASQRLLEAAKDYLAKNDETKYTYTPKIDEIFMAEHPEISTSIKEGDILNFQDSDLEIDGSVIIQSLVINEGDKPVPTYEVTLSNDKITGALEKIQNAISQIAANSTGVTLEQVKSMILSVGTHYFLSRLNDDTAEGKLKFLQDISMEKNLTVHNNITAKGEIIGNQFGNDTFTSGQFGSGFRIWKDASNGQSYAELDNLMVRRETIFNILTIAEIQSVGGQILVSPANMICSKVEETTDGYKCFFETADGTIYNQFAVNDQAICRKFHGQNMKYYWRRVLSIGSDHIILSKTDADGNGIPAKGDDIIQFGNRTNANRQSAIMISAYGSDSPSIKQYAGINSYNLTGKEVTVISPSGNKFTGTFSVKTGNSSVRIPADRGQWTSGMVCYYYDRVSYAGALWLCVIPEGQTTTSAPSDTNTHWQKQVAEGQKGDKGEKGDQGLQGVAGATGKDGVVYYTWIRYANTATGGGISNSPTGKTYIGFAYNKTTPTESNNPADYKWSLIKGEKGDTGVEGAKGEDGKTTFTWIKYSDVADGTGLYDLPKSTTKYIGIAVNKTTATESTNKADYTWSLFKGEDGKDGRDGINGTNGINGTSSYFHVRYSDNANGNPMKTTPAKYIGTAVTQSMAAPSSYTAYTWYEWKGAQGSEGKQGIPGTNGLNGQTSYLHIKYSNDGGKTFTTNSGEDVGDWIGQYVDFTQADSNDVNKYQWSKLKGDKGDAGTLNYIEWKDVWKEGNATITGWINNGTTSENIREYGLNPFGFTSLLWKCVPDSGGNASGGWGTSKIELNTKYAYRYVVFVRKMKGGQTYHGCNDVQNLNGTANGNPYFWNGTNLRVGEWFLMVGIIHPNSVTVNSGLGGVYDMSGKKFATGTDYKFPLDGTGARFRSYLYYSSDATDLQYFFNPMVHRLDGTEPSIEELLQLSTRKVVDAEFKILDDKIATKVSQTDFNSLQGRVSTTESKIEQQAGQISSTVEKVDGKNSVYKSYTSATTDRPTVPYSKDDLWITYNGEIKQSKNTRLTGAFVDSDWVETTKYTDDSAVNNLQLGGRNYALDTSNLIIDTTQNKLINYELSDKFIETLNNLSKKAVVISAYVESKDLVIDSSTHYGIDICVHYEDGTSQFLNLTRNVGLPNNGNIEGKIYHRVNNLSNKKIVNTSNTAIFIRNATSIGKFIIKFLKVEISDKPTDWIPAPEDIQAGIDQAEQAAANAQNSANTANTKLAEIANDNLLTPSEKQDTLKEWDIIKGEYSTVVAQATTYGVATTDYTAKYNALNTYITPLLSNLTINSAIVGSTFRANFKNYYDAKIKLLKLVTDKAKENINTVQSAATAAQLAATNAQNTANTAKTTADTATTRLNNWASDSIISPTEKTALKQQLADIKAEYKDIQAQTSTYALSTSAEWTNYNTAYNNTVTALTKYTATSPENISVGTDYNNITAYYDKRQLILDKIAKAAKSYADTLVNNITIGGRNLITFARMGGTVDAGKFNDNTGRYKDISTNQWRIQNWTTSEAGKYSISFWAKADVAGTISFDTCDQNVKILNLTNAWQFFKFENLSVTNYLTSPYYGFLDFAKGNSTIKNLYLSNLKLEYGTKCSGYTKAPEDYDADIKKAQDAANNAQTSATTANNKLAEIANDNLLTPSEKQDTQKEWDIIKSEYPTVIAQANTFGVATADYTAKYNTLNTYITPLLSSLTTNSNIVGTTFRATFKNYYDSKIKLLKLVTDAAKSAADAAKNVAESASELAKLMAYGKMLYKDPTFKDGLNSVKVYNNSANGMVTINRIAKIAGTPTTSTHCLEIKTIGTPTSPNFGGFSFQNQTRANARFICRFIAKAPAGFNIQWHSNGIGTGGSTKWLSSQAGTGKWQEYLYLINCGDSGTFSTTTFFALQGTYTPSATNPLTWHLAYATVIDITDSEINYEKGITDAQNAANNAQTAANNAQTAANTANSKLGEIANDNLLTPSEKQEALKEWNIIKGEYATVIAQANTYAVATTTYTNAYNALNTYITPLVANLTINSTIVGTTFRNTFKVYYDAKIALLKLVTDKAKALADAAQNTANNIQVGGRNLVLNSNFSNSFTNWNNNGSTTTKTIVTDATFGQVAKITGTAVGNGIYQSLGNRRSSGKTYTFSCYVKSDTPVQIDMKHEGGNGTVAYTTTTGWQRIVGTGIWNSGGALCFYLRAAGTFYLANVQYEEGNKASAWTLAQEDVQSNIANTAAKKVRYIRDWLNGSTANTGNHWVQIMAYNAAGANLALNKPVSGDTTNNRITNGNIDTSVYASVVEGLKYVIVDLGSVQEIQKIKVYHYYADGRTYNATKTECSIDGVNWFTVFDSAVQGKYKETPTGNVIYVTDTAIKNDNSTKNRTYYSDSTPAVPEGGHRVGDLWYKISLTDGCYTTYRWSGTAWVQINVYVSKSRIEQTDSRITSVVEKTGINSLGNGETLYSKINQTATDIRLEVNKIQVGSRNYALNTKYEWYAPVTLTNINNQCIFAHKVLADNWQKGDTITVSFDYKFDNLVRGTGWGANLQGSGNLTAWNYGFGGMSLTAKIGTTATSGSFHVSYSFVISDQQATNDYFNINIRHNYMTGTASIRNLMVEKSTKPSDWQPAPEDIGQIAGSSLTLTDNKISLGAKTIELNGNTIAKAIQAQDLSVKTSDNSNIFEVKNNGRFYSKSVSGTQSLEIDSQNRKIEFKNSTTNYTESGSKTVTQTTKIDASNGRFESSDSDYNTAYISSQGIFANRAGLNPYPSSSGFNLRAAVSGLGFASMRSDYYFNQGIVGVFGRAYNSASTNKSPAYGGWFDVVKANGLCLGVRQISGSTTLNQYDTYVTCYNTADINVYLPANPYDGTVIMIRRVNDKNIHIFGNGKQIHVDGNKYNDMWHKNGRGDTSIFIYDGQFWMFNYWVR